MQFLILYYDELHNGGCKHYTSLIQSKIVTTKIQLQPKQNPIVTTPTTTQHNLNTVVGLDTKMTVQTPPPPITET